jgi:hypothetical protein
MTEREAGTEIIMRLPEQSLELVSVFKEAKKNYQYIFFLNNAG